MLVKDMMEPIISMTTPELHRQIQTWRRQNPQVTDLNHALTLAIEAICPDENPADVLMQAEINWLSYERTKEIKAAAQNVDDWVDTHAQGDMFNPLPFSVPKIMLNKDGKPAKYYELTVMEMAEYLTAAAQSAAVQAAEFQKLADEKRKRQERIAASLDQVRKVIALAKQNGIDPAHLYCANNG